MQSAKPQRKGEKDKGEGGRFQVSGFRFQYLICSLIPTSDLQTSTSEDHHPVIPANAGIRAMREKIKIEKLEASDDKLQSSVIRF